MYDNSPLYEKLNQDRSLHDTGDARTHTSISTLESSRSRQIRLPSSFHNSYSLTPEVTRIEPELRSKKSEAQDKASRESLLHAELEKRANCFQRATLALCCMSKESRGCCDCIHMFVALGTLTCGGYWAWQFVLFLTRKEYQKSIPLGVMSLISFICTIYAVNQFNNLFSILLADFGKRLQELKATERALDQTRQRLDLVHERFQVTTEEFENTQKELKKSTGALSELKTELEGTQEQLDINRQQFEVTVQNLEGIIEQHSQENRALSSEYDQLNEEHAQLNHKYQENIMEQQTLINDTLMAAMSLQKRGSDEVKDLLKRMSAITRDNNDAALEFGRSFVEAHKLREELERVQKKLEKTSLSIEESAISLEASVNKNVEMGEMMEAMIKGITVRKGSLDESRNDNTDVFSKLLKKTVAEMHKNLDEWDGARNRLRTMSAYTFREVRSSSVQSNQLRASLEDAEFRNRSLPRSTQQELGLHQSLSVGSSDVFIL